MIHRLRQRLAWWLWKPGAIGIGNRLSIDMIGDDWPVEVHSINVYLKQGRTRIVIEAHPPGRHW